MQASHSSGKALAAFVESASDLLSRRHALRAALEQVNRIATEEAAPLLVGWLTSGIATTEDLRQTLAGQLLRVALRQRDGSLLHLAAPHLAPQTVGLAQALLTEEGRLPNASDPALPRGVQQALWLVAAAQRGDLTTVTRLLEETDAWRTLKAPPRFVLRALAALVGAKPGHPAWTRTLARWLNLWRAGSLGVEGATLAGIAGLAGGDESPPPAGVSTEAWAAHLTARALLRDDPAQAVCAIRRVGEPNLVGLIERLAAAQRLGQGVGYRRPALLTDMVDLLGRHPVGASLLSCPAAEVQQKLAQLGDCPDVPGRLLHHLALIETRLAAAHENVDPLLATLHGRRAWNAWLGFLAASDGPSAQARALLVEHLVGWHRQRINDHLSRDEREPARSHWQLVMQLPGLARQRAPSLVEELTACVERFRDELATEYLLTTRDTMRFGDIPEGWRADYERGLALLQRLVALDRDNVRLLTAFVETCDEWFLDLYHLQDRRLIAEVERQLPLAEQLAELVADREGEVAARSALSDFWKFRGFIAGDRRSKVELYQEALRFNPGNTNVRELLDDLEAHDE
jgi:hypothetical protein